MVTLSLILIYSCYRWCRMERKKLEDIKPILEKVKKSLKKTYGKQLKGIILFGSYARGDSTEGSDIDIIVLLERMEDPVAEKEKFFDAIWQLDLKYDTVISVLPFDEYQFKMRRLPVILNAKKEGIFI
ncbi:nucleotidyltransferase domain-containing protein [Methanophagales archaeon]|nr:MAG: nucleotidyltransferase domain-containing protein [Methanophagales archaeon]